MSKYLVETFYTCTFKIVHKLEELNEKKLAELDNRKDGEVEIMDVKLNNRKTKTIGQKEKSDTSKNNIKLKDSPDISSMLNEKITSKSNVNTFVDTERLNIKSQKFNKKNKSIYH